MGQNESVMSTDSNYSSPFPKSQSSPQMSKKKYISIEDFQDKYDKAYVKRINHSGGQSSTAYSYSSEDHCDDFVSSVLVNNHNENSYYGIWSRMSISMANGPESRVGHFTCFDSCEKGHFVYIGLGADLRTRQLFNDIWRYHLESSTWQKLDVTIDPKSGARATIVNNINSASSKHLLIFGGFANKRYFNDIILIDLIELEKLEQINQEHRKQWIKNKNFVISSSEQEKISAIKSKIVKPLITKNDGLRPCPRSAPVLANYMNKLFIWGGFNGKYPADISILDLSTRTWRKDPNPAIMNGRTGCAYVTDGSKVYIYGGANVSKPIKDKNIENSFHSSSSFNNLRRYSDFEDEYNHLYIFDMETETMESVKTSGSIPEPHLMGAGMVKIEDYLIFLGGRKNVSQFSSKASTNVYSMSLNNFSWRILTVIPDGITTRINDGNVSEDGAFQLPSIHSFSLVYDAAKRMLLTFLGQTSTGQMIEMNSLALCSAVAENHLSHDMKDMLCY